MTELWLSLADLPEQGQEFLIAEQFVWQDPLQEFNIQATLTDPFKARLFLLPGQNGVLVQGAITGCYELPCDRCIQPVKIELETRFEIFEDLPSRHQEAAIESGLIRINQGHPELNAGELLWEQFLLALPVKPLCNKACQGLCTRCGQNLNLSSCNCESRNLDPRMAVFRNLTIENK